MQAYSNTQNNGFANNKASQCDKHDFVRFAESSIWDMQRDYFQRQGIAAWSQGQVPHYVTSHPFMARCYAQLVLGFWRDIQRKMDASTLPEKNTQPLYIIELGAGSGRFAYHFLQQFFEHLDALGGTPPHVCYVMTDFSQTILDSWQANPKFRPFIQQKRLDFALFDAEQHEDITLQHQGTTIKQNALLLPPVVIANYVFDGLRQDLFFLEKEKVFEGWLALETISDKESDNPFDALQLRYEKHALHQPQYQQGPWAELLKSYASKLPPCALLFPNQAIEWIRKIRAFHQINPDLFEDKTLLLLSADRGAHELTELAYQQEPLLAAHGSFSLPVNYHALHSLVHKAGGQVWRAQPQQGLAISAALVSQQSQWSETRVAAHYSLEGFSPNDFYLIKKSLESESEYLSPEQMLAYLRLSYWDTKIFYLCFPYIQEHIASLPWQQQEAWLQAIKALWKHHLPIGEDYDLAFDLATLAASMQRWQVALFLFQQSLLFSGEHPATHFNIGMAYWQLAQGEEATHYINMAVTEHENQHASTPNPTSDQANNKMAEREHDSGLGFDEDAQSHESNMLEQYNQLLAWRIACIEELGDEFITLPNSQNAANSLKLTLLGEHHAHALYRYQSEPQLAQSAGVECLQSVNHAQQWIKAEQQKNKHSFGVFHSEYGLVGVAAIAVAESNKHHQSSQPDTDQEANTCTCARFYYWVAQDFQHRGYGTKIISLLDQVAKHKSFEWLFSTVEQTNLASQRVLKKGNYHILPIDCWEDEQLTPLNVVAKCINQQADNEQVSFQIINHAMTILEPSLQLHWRSPSSSFNNSVSDNQLASVENSKTEVCRHV